MTQFSKSDLEQLDMRYVTKDSCSKVRMNNQKELSKLCADITSLRAYGKVIVGILGAIGTILLTIAVSTLFNFR